jgi:hypothetical protein
MTSFIGNAPNQVPTNGDLGTAAFVEAASLATLTDTQTLTNKTIDIPSNTITGVLPEANGGTGTTVGYNGFKNRIINGAMQIDQRNAGASVTPATSNVYQLDRWITNFTQASKFSIQQNAGSVTSPNGFANYLGITSTSSYSVLTGDFFSIGTNIEGFNTADLKWGTANAATVTLSFWVRSSLTGTFGGSFSNGAADRSYPFIYTISSANTWEYKTITVAGDTTGTWVGATNGVGMRIYFGLGSGSTYAGTAGAWSSNTFISATGATSVVGTNGATFYITGVQLEKGSTATSFDYRPFGQELALCQRYYEKAYDITVVAGTNVGNQASFGAADYLITTAGNGSTGRGMGRIRFAVTKRATPSVQYWDNAGNINAVTYFGLNAEFISSNNTNDAFRGINATQTSLGFTVDTGSSSNPKAGVLWAASAEL